MTNEQVKADIAANLPDNNSGLITPAKLRAELGTMVDYSDTAAAAHNADPAAHGSGVYTVAQLAAFTNANRPTGCVFCSDCLVPEGVGSPVVWNGAVWVCTYCGLIATTSPLTYFREARKRGCDIDTESQFSAFLRPNRFGGAFSVNSGASSGVDSGYDVGTLLYLVGATGYSTVIPNNFAIQSTTRFSSGVRPAETALYYATDVYVSAMSNETDEFAVVFGLLDVTQVATIGASFIGGIYDRGNSVGIGNTGNSANLFAVTRAASTNTVTELGVALGIGRANVRRVEVLKVGASVGMYIDQVLVATHTTNIPSANLQPRTLVLKTAGSAVRYAGVYREFFAARF